MSVASEGHQTHASHPEHEKLSALQERAMSFGKKQLRNAPSNIGDLSVGLWCAAQGVWGAVHVPKVRAAAWKLVRVMLKKMAWMYSLILGPAVFFWPVTLPFTIAFPSLVYSLLTAIPLWAFHDAQRQSRAEMNGLFMAELNRINPTFAQKVQTAYDSKGFVKVPSFYQQLRKDAHFAKMTLVYNAIGLVSIFSPISVTLQTSLASEKLSWSLLQPFMRDYKRMPYEDQRDLIQRRWWTMIGFAAPFVLLGFLPFVSAFTLPLAQAGAAHVALRIEHLHDADSDRTHSSDAYEHPEEQDDDDVKKAQ
mmetsp:Transcript_6932/g.13840  ORF Transcript_6932/g.13840 Transcript_6932/m.13840 type:complete len:307 (-) Transcript_6932:46-966(-)